MKLSSFTTGAVAAKLGRHCIGIELSEEYAALAVKRIEAAVGGSGVGRNVVDRNVFIGHERSVRRKNAVSCRKLDQFLDQFLVLTAKVQLVDDFTDASHGPKFLDKSERFVFALFDHLGGEVELLFLPAHLTANDDLGRARLLITPHDDQLLAGKQVERSLGA